MAKNVIINGVAYQNVPAVKIPLVSDPSQDAEFYDTSDATLSSGDQMLSGYSAYSNGTLYTGSIVPKTGTDITVSGDTVSIPAGYYETAQSASVGVGSASTPATSVTANPTISVDSAGLITSSVSATESVTPTVVAGYVTSGTAGNVSVSGSNTSQLPVQAAQTITPGTSNQTIASGRYLTGTQTILGDANLVASNILRNVSIFGVMGTLALPNISQDATTKVLSIS